MSRTVLLGEIAEIFDKKRIPLNSRQRADRKGAIPYYGATGVLDFVDKPLFDGEYVLIGEDGENLRSKKSDLAFKVSGKFWVNNHAHILQGNEPWINDYIVNVFRAIDISPYVTGAAQPKLNQAALMSIPIYWPGENEAKRIASLLSSIDEKIELNRRMNETLEQIGQALFRHHFIDNPEVDKWDKKSLGDLVSLTNGASYKSSELQPSKSALVTLKSIERGGGFSRRGYKEFAGKFKRAQIVQDGDLVVAHTDLTQKAEVAGHPAIVDGADQYSQVGISMDLVKVVSQRPEISSSFIYFLLRTQEFQDYKMGYISGSTVLHLNKKCIPSYEIALMNDEDALRKISSSFDDLMEKIKINNQEIHELTTLRDTLLPRLISGKVKI